MWPFTNRAEEKRIEAFAAAHPVGGLKIPTNVDELPKLSAAAGFIAPVVVDSRGYCTITEDQGTTSMCAAYATTSFAENIMWRQTHKPPMYDPVMVYNKAKELDGDTSAGTTLDHAAEAFLSVYKDVFDKECKPLLIRGRSGDLTDLVYAIHKYGCAVGGFNITDAWYGAKNTWIPSGGTAAGGHAVLVCGYNENGLIIQNSWGRDWGEKGFAVLRWADAYSQFIYGCVLKGCMKHIDD